MSYFDTEDRQPPAEGARPSRLAEAVGKTMVEAGLTLPPLHVDGSEDNDIRERTLEERQASTAQPEVQMQLTNLATQPEQSAQEADATTETGFQREHERDFNALSNEESAAEVEEIEAAESEHDHERPQGRKRRYSIGLNIIKVFNKGLKRDIESQVAASATGPEDIFGRPKAKTMGEKGALERKGLARATEQQRQQDFHSRKGQQHADVKNAKNALGSDMDGIATLNKPFGANMAAEKDLTPEEPAKKSAEKEEGLARSEKNLLEKSLTNKETETPKQEKASELAKAPTLESQLGRLDPDTTPHVANLARQRGKGGGPERGM